MRKIAIYIMGFVLVFQGCTKDFLNLNPESEANANDFFKTEEQFEQALSGAYQQLRGIFGESGFLMGEMRSDNTHYDYYAPDRGLHIIRRENIDDFLDDEQNQWTNDYYNNSYVGITRVNTILDRIDQVDFDKAKKDRIIGEAKFLRAFYYFNLVRYFGGVPLFLHEVVREEDAFIARSTVDMVYETIISDAQDAISKLPDPTFPQNGRATKGSASVLLADVYMTRKDFAGALPLLNSVKTMGYSLLSNYADVFKTANKNSNESVFEIQYMMGDQGQQSMFIYWFAPKTNDVKLITGVSSNTLNYGGWNVPTEDMLNTYEKGDSRKDASVGIAEGVIAADGSFGIQAVKSSVNYVLPAGKVAKPFIKKYLNPHTRERNTDDNFPVYRYSDVLLMHAECLNETGASAQALDDLKKVRTRAGSTLSPINNTNQSALRDLIAKERRVELAYENHRWFDLLRTDKAIEVMSKHGLVMKSLYNYLSPKAYQVTEQKLLYPIPYLERQLNDKITQNPGY